MTYSDPTRPFYDACNRTELYQLCARVGLVVSPAAPREKLVSYLLGEEEPPAVEHPVHVWRNGLIGLIQDYWTGIEAQLRCPAKELGPPAREGEPPKADPSDPKAPLACYRCIDTRVVSCLVENVPHEGLIQLHRKMLVQPKDPNMTMSIGTLTLDTAPRTLEGMSAGNGVDRGTLKRLWDRLAADGAAPTDEKTTVAFVDGTLESRRQMVVQYLKVWDEMRETSRGGQGSVVPATEAPGAPAPTPVVGGAPVAPQPPSNAEPPRTPTVRGKRSAAPPTTTNATPTEDGDISDRLYARLNEIHASLGAIKDLMLTIGKHTDHLNQVLDAHQAVQDKRHDELLGELCLLSETVKTTAAINLWQIENAGQDAPSAILAQRATYISILDRALEGKGEG